MSFNLTEAYNWHLTSAMSPLTSLHINPTLLNKMQFWSVHLCCHSLCDTNSSQIWKITTAKCHFAALSLTSYNMCLTWRVTERNGSTYRRTHIRTYTHTEGEQLRERQGEKAKGCKWREKEEKERGRDRMREIWVRGFDISVAVHL